MRPDSNLRSFIEAYIDCALWTGAEPPDWYPGKGHNKFCDMDPLLIDASTAARMVFDCIEFYSAWNHHFPNREEASLAGHDFWLTRNGHGTGFWDNGGGRRAYSDEIGKELTLAAKAFGEYDLYADGEIVIHGS